MAFCGNFNISSSRSFVSAEHPFLGALPDGLIACECCTSGTVGVKCPLQAEKSSIKKSPKIKEIVALKHALMAVHDHCYF